VILLFNHLLTLPEGKISGNRIITRIFKQETELIRYLLTTSKYIEL